PGGVPTATVAIGKAGATNAGILAAQILGIFDEKIAANLQRNREEMQDKVAEMREELADK
ncbi:AIR carboxylase family protein, partial [Oceanobacillus caeni]